MKAVHAVVVDDEPGEVAMASPTKGRCGCA
jgi:hypothetical protein